jgi:hypothetical protein
MVHGGRRRRGDRNLMRTCGEAKGDKQRAGTWMEKAA